MFPGENCSLGGGIPSKPFFASFAIVNASRTKPTPINAEFRPFAIFLFFESLFDSSTAEFLSVISLSTSASLIGFPGRVALRISRFFVFIIWFCTFIFLSKPSFASIAAFTKVPESVVASRTSINSGVSNTSKSGLPFFLTFSSTAIRRESGYSYSS